MERTGCRLPSCVECCKQIPESAAIHTEGMDGMMGSGTMWGAGFFWLLILVVLVLAAGALIKYLFFSSGLG